MRKANGNKMKADRKTADLDRESKRIRRMLLAGIRRRYNKAHTLLRNIKRELPKLKAMLAKLDAWDGEDGIYRYYHGSFKAYQLQYTVKEIVKLLKKASPSRPVELCPLFMDAVSAAMGNVEWIHEHNSEWEKNVRPFVDSYFHAEYFLRMLVKYGEELENAPDILPSGWAAVLELYRIR